MNKEDVIYIYISISIYIYITYIWNVERWYQRIYLQDSNGETDNKGQTYGHGGGEERVRCMERVTWKLILPYVK